MGTFKSLFVASAFLMMLTLPFPAAAAPGDVILPGFGSAGKAAGYPVGSGNTPKVEFAAAFLTYANGLLGLMGLLFMIQIIYSGWLWLSARGNEEQVNKAKQRILHTVIALAVIISARIIVELVITVVGTIATT